MVWDGKGWLWHVGDRVWAPLWPETVMPMDTGAAPPPSASAAVTRCARCKGQGWGFSTHGGSNVGHPLSGTPTFGHIYNTITRASRSSIAAPKHGQFDQFLDDCDYWSCHLMHIDLNSRCAWMRACIFGLRIRAIFFRVSMTCLMLLNR